MAEFDSQTDELSLADLIRSVWHYRVVFLVCAISWCAVFIAGVLLVYFWTPSVQSSRLAFRVLFDGAGENHYPNGLPYSATDITASPVLEQVYQQNRLERFMSFDEFKNAIFISETNAALTLLDKEYQQKLGNSKLSMVDRQLLENEYREKRESLSNQSYELHFVKDGFASELPADLVDKLLRDILKNWVALADDHKGVLKYRIPVFSRNILPQSLLEAQDYIVTIDIFDNKINAILGNIDQLRVLPGASLVRIGDENLGLEEIATNLRDVQNFKLDPLVGLVRSTGLSKTPSLATLYLENQLFQIQLDQQESQQKIRVLEDSLSSYLEKKVVGESSSKPSAATEKVGAVTTTYIPQFGDSFLDRVMEMSTQSNDAEFRQNVVNMIVAEGIKVAALQKKAVYYQSLIDAMKKASKATGQTEDVVSLIKSRFGEIEEDILQALDQVNQVYTVLSETNLNPQAGFYRVTAPVKESVDHGIGTKKVLVAGIAGLFLLLIAASIGCVVHAQLRTKHGH